jgi:hypothetical protein
MVEPIKPNEVSDIRDSLIPDEVITVFNELILDRWNGSYAQFTVTDAANMVAKVLGIESNEIYSRHLLDVEEIFRKVGWVVLYDRPGYNEDYPATFKFSRK